MRGGAGLSNHKAVHDEWRVAHHPALRLYTGLTRRDVDKRVSEHRQGFAALTRTRRPVELLSSEHYPAITDAIDAERRIKGWSRAKKLAHIARDFERLSLLAQRRGRG